MKSDEALAAEQAVEAKLAEAGLDTVRRHSFEEAPEAAPVETDTAAETEDRPRNELGQFTTTEPEAEEEIPADEQVTEEVAPTGQDPAVAALLAKYGGNVEKALEAAVHAQRKLGQQSSEVGDLRARTAEQDAIIAELQGLRQDFAQSRSNMPLDQGTIDWFDQQAYENPYAAAEMARQQNNNVLFQRALGIMKETAPGDYAVYVNNLENQRFRAEIEQKIQQAQNLPVDATVNLALQNVRNRNPQFANYDDAIEQTLQRHPFAARALEQATQSGEAAQIEGAIETLYSLAVGDTLQALALQAPTPEAETTAAEVAVPSVAETRDPPPEPTNTDRFREAFRQEAERQRNGAWVAG